MHVMRSDIDSGVPPPPPLELSTPVVSAQEILAMDSDALEGHLQQRLRRGRPGQQFEERAEDGSPRIPSLVSVWLISQVGHAVGRQKVVNLSKVKNNKDLRSLAGVARLLGEALAELQPAQEAS